MLQQIGVSGQNKTTLPQSSEGSRLILEARKFFACKGIQSLPPEEYVEKGERSKREVGKRGEEEEKEEKERDWIRGYGRVFEFRGRLGTSPVSPFSVLKIEKFAFSFFILLRCRFRPKVGFSFTFFCLYFCPFFTGSWIHVQV